MKFLVAGALGEVGSTVSSALESLGHTVVPASSRGGRPGIPALSLDQAVSEVEQGRVHAVLSAAGRGDRRVVERTGRESTPVVASAAERQGIPAVLLSTTRVLEGYAGLVDDDARPDCSTPYACANAENETSWLEAAPSVGTVVRIANYFAAPSSAESPQSLLLPWSLVTEAVRTGGVIVRSAPSTSREFVSAGDVARAIVAVASAQGSVRLCATAPGMTASLAELVTCVSDALAAVGLQRPAVSFGDDSHSASACRPGWLHEQGWCSTLNLEEVTRAITTWLSRVELD